MRDPLYFYGDEPYEADENAILIPKELVFTEAFAKLPGDAQILYFVMLEYLNDAEEKGWIDEEGKLYIEFPIQEIMNLLHCSERKAIRLLEELDEQKGLGLIKKKTQGGKKPNRLYLKPLAKVKGTERKVMFRNSERNRSRYGETIKTHEKKTYQVIDSNGDVWTDGSMGLGNPAKYSMEIGGQYAVRRHRSFYQYPAFE